MGWENILKEIRLNMEFEKKKKKKNGLKMKKIFLIILILMMKDIKIFFNGLLKKLKKA